MHRVSERTSWKQEQTNSSTCLLQRRKGEGNLEEEWLIAHLVGEG